MLDGLIKKKYCYSKFTFKLIVLLKITMMAQMGNSCFTRIMASLTIKLNNDLERIFNGKLPLNQIKSRLKLKLCG